MSRIKQKHAACNYSLILSIHFSSDFRTIHLSWSHFNAVFSAWNIIISREYWSTYTQSRICRVNGFALKGETGSTKSLWVLEL